MRPAISTPKLTAGLTWQPDWTDPISHRDDSQSECERNSENVDGCRPGSHPGDDSRAASEEDKRKRPNKFCSWLFHVHSLRVAFSPAFAGSLNSRECLSFVALLEGTCAVLARAFLVEGRLRA